MKTILKLLILSGVFICSGNSCEKISQKDTSFTGRIIKYTCGGTVIQFIKTDLDIGETWANYFSSPIVTYTNCVLVGNLQQGIIKEEDTIGFNYEKVDSFKTGLFCDIGGLPKTKIEISDLQTIKK